MSLIELVVALVLITIVLLAGLTAINFGLTSSNNQRLKVEATNLALTTMEQEEPLAQSLNIGQTTTTQTINTTTFTIVSNISEYDQNGGTLTSACTSNAASQSQQIWQVAVVVSWAHMRGMPPISQSTEVAPGQSTAQDLANAELAVGIEGANGLPLTTPLNFTVTPVATGPPNGPYVPPSGDTSPVGQTPPFNTGANGCGVVTGLSTTGWSYTVTVVGNPGWVSSNEASDSNPAGDPTATDLLALAGQVTRVNPATPLQMAYVSSPTAVVLQPVSYSCAGGNPTPACYLLPLAAGYAAPISTLPVTVANTSLTSGQYTFGGNGTTATTSALLYPYSLYDIWSGDMAQSNPGYSAPASGVPFYNGGAAQTPAPVTLSPPAATTTVPTYDLSVKVTTPCAGNSLVATEQAGSTLPYTLNAGLLNVSTSGMPLGQYLLSSTGGSCPVLKATGTAGLYIWITPTGVYTATAEMTSPYAVGNTLIAANASVQVTE